MNSNGKRSDKKEMPEDLRWLAENVSEWPEGQKSVLVFGRNNTFWYSDNRGFSAGYLKKDWQSARQKLGLDSTDSDESHNKPTPEEDDAFRHVEQVGKKYDSDKPMMDLIPPYMEEEVAKVLTFGAKKYAPGNWRKVEPLRSRYLAAAQRHINALKKGESHDPESGLHHAAHAACCLMFLGEVELEL